MLAILGSYAALRWCSAPFLAHLDLQVLMTLGTYYFPRHLQQRDAMAVKTSLAPQRIADILIDP